MFEDIYHFMQLDDRLFTAGMPTAEQLADAAQAGVQVVINLAMPDSERALVDEPAVVEALKMKYIGIPVQWEHPTRPDLDRFMDAMVANQDATVLVHCQANYRVTAFVTLYRVLRLAWNTDEAFKDLRRIWDPDDYPVWKKFLEENLGAGQRRPKSEAGP